MLIGNRTQSGTKLGTNKNIWHGTRLRVGEGKPDTILKRQDHRVSFRFLLQEYKFSGLISKCLMHNFYPKL